MSFCPLISIVMPTYNRAGYILQTIESIQNQTYQNWELIIEDDGSDDCTEEIIKNINDKRINFFKELHVGMEEARNRGLGKARGDLIGFMDSDDLWHPTKLEKQVEAFKNYPGAFFSLAGGYEFTEVGKPIVFFYKQKDGVKFGNLFISFFKSEVVALPQTFVFKKECLGMVNFSKDIELGHIHFILDLALNFKGVLLYEALFSRRLHHSNYSTLNHAKRHNDGIDMIKYYKGNLPKKVYTTCLFKSHINFGENLLIDQRTMNAMEQFLTAWKYKPVSIIPIKKITKSLLSYLK